MRPHSLGCRPSIHARSLSDTVKVLRSGKHGHVKIGRETSRRHEAARCHSAQDAFAKRNTRQGQPRLRLAKVPARTRSSWSSREHPRGHSCFRRWFAMLLTAESHICVHTEQNRRHVTSTYTITAVGVQSQQDAKASGELAEQSVEAVPAPAVCRAQAVQQAILQASDSDTSSTSGNSADTADRSDTDASDSETSDHRLAKLSQNMFNALRSESGRQSAAERATDSGTAERNSLRASQPDVLQAGRLQTTQGSLHWLTHPYCCCC